MEIAKAKKRADQKEKEIALAEAKVKKEAQE
jgi:hypothetical protein